MKEEFKISKKNLIVLFSILAILVLIAVFVLSKNYLNYRANTNALIGQQINGIIKSMKDQSRGSYFLEIQTEKEIISVHSLPVAWEVKKYNIQVGDSISKEANSRIMKFYKSRNGVIEKICEFEM
jgi:hypothetical protein